VTDAKQLEKLYGRVRQSTWHGDTQIYVGEVDLDEFKALALRLLEERDNALDDLRTLREARDPGGCQCADEEACRFVRERDEARARTRSTAGSSRRACPLTGSAGSGSSSSRRSTSGSTPVGPGQTLRSKTR